MATRDDETPGTSTTHYWREYPVGFGGELARVFVRTLIPFGVALLLTFALILVIGIVNEENLISEALYGVLSAEARDAIATGLDYLFRMSMLPLLIVGYLVGLGSCVALCARDVTASTALATAAKSGASRSAVPHPRQVESVIKERFWPIWIFLVISTGCLLLVAILLVIFSLAEGFPEGLLVALGLVVAAAIFGLCFYVVHRELPVKHAARRAIIAAHWTFDHESAAWTAARASEKESVGSTARDPRIKRGRRILKRSSAFGGVAVVLLYAVMMITHPYARGGGNPDAGPRVTYPDAIETMLAAAMWIMLGLVALAVAGAIVGQFFEGLGRQAEMTSLRDALADPNSPRPGTQLLADYANRRSVGLAQTLAMLSGIGIVLGPSALLLGLFRSDNFRGGLELFTSFRPAAIITTVVAILLFIAALLWNAARSRGDAELRNELIRRWPALPTDTTDSDDKVVPARVGPALQEPRSVRDDRL